MRVLPEVVLSGDHHSCGQRWYSKGRNPLPQIPRFLQGVNREKPSPISGPYGMPIGSHLAAVFLRLGDPVR